MREIAGRGVPLPARRVPGVYEVVRPQLGQPLDVVLCERYWRGYWTHPMLREDGSWDCTTLCIGTGLCQVDHQAVPQRWAGYIAGIRQDGLRLCVVTLTREVADSMQRQLAKDENLLSTRWLLERQGFAKNGLIRVTRQPDRAGRMPGQGVDVERSLQHLFRLPALPVNLVGGPDYERGEK